MKDINMTRKLKIIIPLLSFTLVKSAMAHPTSYAHGCGPLTIANPTHSNLVRDHEDCNKVWVLPPTRGQVQLAHFTSSGNIGFCRELKNTYDLSARLLKKISQFDEKIELLEPEMKEKEEQLEAAQAAYLALENIPELYELKAKEKEIKDTEIKIDDLLFSIAQCEDKCPEKNQELSYHRERRLHLKTSLHQLQIEYRPMLKKRLVAQGKFEASKKRAAQLAQTFDDLLDRQLKLRNHLQKWVGHFSQLEGGFAQMGYELSWNQNKVKLQKLYEGEYEFEIIPTRNARINAHFVGNSSREVFLNSNPSILDYTFGGFKFLPWGREEVKELSALPDGFSGSIRLSLPSSCHLAYANFFESDELTPHQNEVDNRKYALGATVTFQYPTAFHFQVQADYNLYRLYERMTKNQVKRRFFKRKHYKEILESTEEKSSFNIRFGEQSAEIPTEAKRHIKNIIKSSLMDRVLGTMAIPIPPQKSIQAPILPFSFESGSTVLAKGIDQTCAHFNFYCLGASWIFKGLDAAFGNDMAQDRFRRIYNRHVSESWDEFNTHWLSQSVSFFPIDQNHVITY